MTLISPGDCILQMWHVALSSWQWIHQVAAPCSVIRGSGMICRWIRPVAAPCNVTALGSWHSIRQVAAPCNMTGGLQVWFPKHPQTWANSWRSYRLTCTKNKRLNIWSMGWFLWFVEVKLNRQSEQISFGTSSSFRMCVMNHNWSARKQRLHLQSAAGISCHSALSEFSQRTLWERLLWIFMPVPVLTCSDLS